MAALDGVSVEFGRGQFTAAMGPSGCGKSTLLHCLVALDDATSGQVFIGDAELTSLNDKQLTLIRRDRIGFVFQVYNLVPTLTAMENITLPMDIAGRTPDPQWLKTVIGTLGLSGPARSQAQPTLRRPAATGCLCAGADQSAGNHLRRRAHREPGLGGSAEVLAFLRRCVRDFGQTVVMVTHDPAVAGYSDWVLFLADGRIVGEMTDPTAARVLDRMKGLDTTTARAGAMS